MEYGINTFIYMLLGWNLITFLVMGIDKWKAKKNRRRISESTLLLLAFFFGAVGVLAAMPIFHHKTKKPLFLVLVPAALIVNSLAFYSAYLL